MIPRLIPAVPSTGTVTGTVTGTFTDNATGAPIVGAEVPVIDANGNSVTGVTDGNGNFQSETPAGESKVNYINFNGSTISIAEIVFNVTIGEIYNIGTVGVDRESSRDTLYLVKMWIDAITKNKSIPPR